MKFIDEDAFESEEEKEIIAIANEAIIKLKKWKTLEKKRWYMTEDIKKAMMLKFPKLTYCRLEHDSISLETDLHSNHVSKYTDSDKKNVPSFKCDIQVKDMPNTAEEFLEMKKNIEKDRQEIMTAMYYVLFRYDIYEKV